MSRKKHPYHGTALQWAIPLMKKEQQRIRRARKEKLWAEYGLIQKPTPWVPYTPPEPAEPLISGKPIHAFLRLINAIERVSTTS